MSLIYFTPGPSQLYPTYATHLQEAMQLQLGSVNHRSQTFRDIYAHTDTMLRQLMGIPAGYSIYFAASATEIWEKILLNLVEKRSHHLVYGAFSKRFYEFAQLLQKEPSITRAEDGQGFLTNSILVPDDTELLCITQNETATGAYMPGESLVQLRRNVPQALHCADLVSCAPCVPLSIDAMDAVFFSVQKAFGMPPGLGVWIANEACMDKARFIKKQGRMIGAYHTLESYATHYAHFETPSTPNVLAIYLLGKIAEDMLHKGIHIIQEETRHKAALLYSFADNHAGCEVWVADKQLRSPTVLVAHVNRPASEIQAALKQKGFVIGSGYGAKKSSQIRIANFPATSETEIKALLQELGPLLT